MIVFEFMKQANFVSADVEELDDQVLYRFWLSENMDNNEDQIIILIPKSTISKHILPEFEEYSIIKELKEDKND